MPRYLDLSRAAAEMAAELNREIRPFGLTANSFYALLSLLDQDNQRPSDLARSIGMAATSFTPVLDGLEQKGYIRRQTNAGDRRSLLVTTTPQAHKVEAQLRDIAAKYND